MLAAGTSGAWTELDILGDPARRDQGMLARLGAPGSMAVGGAAFTVSGTLERAQVLKESSRLTRWSRLSGRLGGVATVVTGGVVVWRYDHGELPERQFARLTTGTVGGALGAWAFAGVGAALGTAIAPGPGTVIGGLVGALAGGLGGSRRSSPRTPGRAAASASESAPSAL